VLYIRHNYIYIYLYVTFTLQLLWFLENGSLKTETYGCVNNIDDWDRDLLVTV
jgi:hypothetical protein